jgi:hypothetical protein
MGVPQLDTPPFAYEAFHAVRRPHPRLILHFRGLGINSQQETRWATQGAARNKELHARTASEKKEKQGNLVGDTRRQVKKAAACQRVSVML